MKQPTCTSVVLAALLAIDDFATAKQLKDTTGLNANQISASLHELRKYKVVDCLSEAGQLWWYATPDTDQRHHTVALRKEEKMPRKQRKSNKEKSA